jgi:hypothetical protein
MGRPYDLPAITMTANPLSLPDLKSIAEAVVQADPQDVGGKSEAFGNNHAADIVVEYRMIAEIHVEIFGLSRPILIKHRLYPDAGSPTNDRGRTRAECAIGGNIAFLAVERADGKTAGHVRQDILHREAGAPTQGGQRLKICKAARRRAAAIAEEWTGSDG